MTSSPAPNVTSSFPRRLGWPTLASALLIVLMAFALRALVVLERASGGDDRFIPPPLTDMHTYYEAARLVATGGQHGPLSAGRGLLVRAGPAPAGR